MIKLINAKKSYQNGSVTTDAINNLNLEIFKDEYIAIMGTSGSGKSTLLNVLGGMDVLSSGQYLFEGKDITNLKGKKLDLFRKKNIGFVFQNFALLDQYTVYENVELPLISQKVSVGKRKKIINDILVKLQIEDLKNKRAKEISGGQQQRCAIARALATGAPIILADEPTGSLDSKTSKEIMDVFEQVHKEGKTIIMVTHDEKVAKRAQRIIRLEDGNIVND